MTDRQLWPVASLLIAAAGVLVGCQLPAALNSQATVAPTATATSVAATAAPATASPRAPAATDTPAEPTAPPLELGPTEPLPALAADQALTWTTVRFFDGQAGWAIGGVAGDDQRLLRTEDGGATWRDRSPPIQSELLSTGYHGQMLVIDPAQAWFVRFGPFDPGLGGSSALVVWRTSDGGASWQSSQPVRTPFIGREGTRPYLLYADSDVLWLLARAGGAGMHQYPVAFFRSQDGGASWTKISDPFTESGTGLISCHKSGMAANGSIGVLTIDSCPITGAQVYLSVDSGDTWETRPLPAPEDAPEVYEQGVCESHSPAFLGDGSLVVGMTCRVFEPEDATFAYLYRADPPFDSWQVIEAPPGGLQFVDEAALWSLSRELWFSADAGQSWELRKTVFWDGQFSFVSDQVGFAVAVDDEEVALVGTHDGGDTWQIIEVALAIGQ